VGCSDEPNAGVEPDGPTSGTGLEGMSSGAQGTQGSTDGTGGDATNTGTDAMPPDDDDELEPLSNEDVRFYLQRVAPTVVGRSLSYDETAEIEERGEGAISDIVQSWVHEPGFAESIRYLVQTQLHASGSDGDIDFELPGNLAAEIARDGLPWSTLLTADYCVDALDNHVQCDTGAPYGAGVLATRAYLSSNRGRFNLGRAKVMLEVFACQAYPMAVSIQTPLDKTALIPMFRAETMDEQTVEEAQGGFGNGVGCYSCHSQFGAHAQLFVKYDLDGRFRSGATGLQNPSDELGRSYNGLYASHLQDPASASSESSQMFGEPVDGLREAAEILAYSRFFTKCTVKNLIAASFGLLAGTSEDIDPTLLSAIADAVTADDGDPTISAYVTATFTNSGVVRAAVAPLRAQDT